MKQPIKPKVRLKTKKVIYSRGPEAEIQVYTSTDELDKGNVMQNFVGVFVNTFFRRERVYRNCEVLRRVYNSKNMIQCLSSHHNGKTKKEPSLSH